MNTENTSINPMCADCACFCKDCKGTTRQIWTSCVYKKTKDEEEE